MTNEPLVSIFRPIFPAVLTEADERCELECYSKVLSYVRVTRFGFLALGHILTNQKISFCLNTLRYRASQSYTRQLIGTDYPGQIALVRQNVPDIPDSS